MATATHAMRAQTHTQPQSTYPPGSIRFDWSFMLLGSLLIGGLMVDGWAHYHGRTDNTFFTPWHFLFYSAFGFVALFLAYHQLRNVSQGYPMRRALPQGYGLSLLGAITFALGGVGDLIWHTLFGIEAGSEALTSPTHLMLAVGMGLIVTGPVRSAWLRRDAGGWRRLGPALIGSSLFLLLLAFFTAYAHPFVYPAAMDFSSGGSQTTAQSSELYLMNRDGSSQTRLTVDPTLGVYGAAWSPDGSQIVISLGDSSDEVNGESALYLMDADGGNRVKLTEAVGLEYDPAWSPDGSQVVYTGEVDGRVDLYMIQSDGSSLKRLTNTPAEEWLSAWSPDGKQIATTIFAEDNFHIEFLQADGSGSTTFPVAGGSGTATFSPDGSQIAYGSDAAGSFDIWVAKVDGSDAKQLSNSSEFDGFPVWSSDGSQLYFTSWRSGTSEIYVMPVTGETEDQPAVNLTHNPALVSNHPGLSPDGSQILYTAQGQSSDDNQGSNQSQDAGVAAILLQSVFVAGVLLLLVRRWKLPFGAVTFVLTLSTVLITVLTDMYFLIPGAIITGLIADVLVQRLQPYEQVGRYHLFAFVVPVLFYGCYMLTVQLIAGIGWSIHVWTGAIFLTGLIGLLLSYLMTISASEETVAKPTAGA